MHYRRKNNKLTEIKLLNRLENLFLPALIIKLLIVTLLQANLAFGLEVIHEGSLNTNPSNHYYDAAVPIVLDATQLENHIRAIGVPARPPIRDNKSALVAAMLPISTEGLTVSRGFTKRRVSIKGLLNPFCLVGYDDFSFEWLQQNKQLLLDENVVCFVVNVSDMDEWYEIESLIPELNFIPANVAPLIARLNIESYPVIISASAIYQ